MLDIKCKPNGESKGRKVNYYLLGLVSYFKCFGVKFN